jgi:aspartyl-tRNA(Asn)/glutamyl-tRNA(Gln) amidotransferase subunit C
MKLDIEQVEYIAALARLQLSPEEKARFGEQLSAILDYVARLQELDTAQIPPASSVLVGQATLREDHPRPGMTQEELFRNAPQVEKEQFRLPAVFE